MSGQDETSPRTGTSRASLFIPLVVFALLSVLLYRGFFLGDPHALPSALIDDPLPQFDLPDLQRPGQRVSRDAILGEPFLLNVWATWCPTCRAEHDTLNAIAEQTGTPIYGVNYKDDPEAARIWLQRFGDPYRRSVIDLDGSLGIDLGVYGAPETFVVDARGVIRYKRIGAVDERVWEDELAPILRALADQAGTGDDS